MISTKSVANAFSGKTARPCDSCIKKRARWYCAADDAFLCQACDSSVHSANPLARRHERVRLKTASFKLLSGSERTSPSWHKGFTKKARTRRSPKGWKWKTNPVPFVPEVGADEISHEENEEEQLLYRVPIFDPFVAELCGDAAMADEKSEPAAVTAANSDKSWNKAAIFGQDGDNKLRGFFPSDLELVDFAADVESMLGKGLEDQSFGMEDLGLVDSEEKDVKVAVKVEKDDQCEESSRESRGGEPDRMELDVDCRETFELNFDYDSPASCGEDDERLVKEEEEKVDSGWPGEGGEEENSGKGRRKVLLSLDYEGVIGAWASRGSPWTTEERPEIDPGECLLNFWVVGGKGMSLAAYGEFGGMGMAPAIGADGGREARVSRYREKRRTRLFSKKIRYEVRKLNAEKRPRMKGRFVKRVSYGAPSNSFALS